MKEDIKMIPINQIRILNPRHRDRKKFEIIIQSIKNVGLKKPIQISLRSKNEDGGAGYDLVCGQGRMEAFMALGHKEIPAIIVEISKEERLLRSLVENLARKFPAPKDLIQEIERLKSQGYNLIQIGEKLGVGETLVRGLVALKKEGEERLLEAALNGKVPITVAIDIARANTVEAQRALLKAFENRQLNYLSIRTVKRLIDQRQFLGKNIRRGVGNSQRNRDSAKNLVSVFRRESERQRLLVKKAQMCETKLLCIVAAFNKLLADLSFTTLLKAESLITMPKGLWSKLETKTLEAA